MTALLPKAQWITNARTNKGLIYREDGSSGSNAVDLNVMLAGTHYYDTAYVTSSASTNVGSGNRPVTAWP